MFYVFTFKLCLFLVHSQIMKFGNYVS
jgi:hypothetical protein